MILKSNQTAFVLASHREYGSTDIVFATENAETFKEGTDFFV